MLFRSNDGEIPAYRALPETGGPFPVILVVQEIFGVHEHIKDLCRRLAHSGYCAVAPELFARQGDVSKMTDANEIVTQVVSKVPDAGGYRLQADYAKPGWSSLILLTGQGPFPRALLTQPAGPRSAAWSSQFAAAARAGGWRAEMAWYDIMTGSDLSVIPQTQATSANSAVITNALVAGRLLQQQQQARRAKASNATAAGPTNAAASAAAANVTVTTSPTAKGAMSHGKDAPTNTAKSDAPL